MFRRPSSRRKAASNEVTINLVPMLDALVTLVAFLLISTAFLSIVVIDTPAPLLAPAEEQEKILDKDKPLQLTAYIQENQIILSDWSGSRENHTIPSVADAKTGEKRYDLEALHKMLIEIKSRHPKETKLILKPESGVAYEMIVGIMDAARFFEKSDPSTPMKKNEKTGVDEVDKKLFPEVIFGNIMS
jgi:biopolymer transport protein ExbD